MGVVEIRVGFKIAGILVEFRSCVLENPVLTARESPSLQTKHVIINLKMLKPHMLGLRAWCRYMGLPAILMNAILCPEGRGDAERQAEHRQVPGVREA